MGLIKGLKRRVSKISKEITSYFKISLFAPSKNLRIQESFVKFEHYIIFFFFKNTRKGEKAIAKEIR